LRTSRADDDLSIRVQGSELDVLARVGDTILKRVKGLSGLRNAQHSAEEVRQEFAVQIDRERAAELGIDVADVGRALRIALDGLVISDFIDGDRSYNIRVRLPRVDVDSPDALGRILLFGETTKREAVYLHDVAATELVPVPVEIKRDNQQRIVEITASLTGDLTLGEVVENVREALKNFTLPLGYYLTIGGEYESLEQTKNITRVLIGLALFLVFVVMAVQYESLRNPTIIILSVPFALIGVALGLWLSGLPLSVPVWLGIIMLVGIVVNNAIVLVEYIEIMREKGEALRPAIVQAARLRLRPVMMTTLTTTIGMSPLAIGIGEGSEMLQPLAVTIVSGLLVSMFVTLVLVPSVYLLAHTRGQMESKTA
jgi:multidrug efflux pump subunit AcrB